MSQPLHLALVWHMHQPDYHDPQTGRPLLPWVRLHSTRAYFDMAWMLERHPQVKGTFNFVPVLLAQLEDIVERGERDAYFDLTAKPAETLTDSEKIFILRNWFACNWDTCVRPRPRYWSLLNKRGHKPPFRSPAEFGPQDMRDLQVLFNLAWMGYAAPRVYPEIAELDAKGAGYTEAEKLRLLDLQLEIMGRVVPMYRALSERGQVELTTTPFYHPILPLLIDSDAAKRCQPELPAPRRFHWPSDATVHLERAIAFHTRTFGRPPIGMWPSEGSVSPEAVALIADAGIEWIATDESQLWGSVDSELPRRELFQPWRIDVDGARLDVVFRDHGLSDLIGFTYSRNAASVAAEDLISRLRSIHHDTGGDTADGADARPALVSVILDGENPWEHYPDSGFDFLDTLYSNLARTPWLRTVTVGDHIAAAPPSRTLKRLHSGSWIMGNFSIWCGGKVENAAWRVLGEARQFFEQNRGKADAAAVEIAYEHLLAAEGSDWFWWYGDHFTSELDAEFDYLFRAHVRVAYTSLGGTPPRALTSSLYPDAKPAHATPPRAFVTPCFGDTESTWYDWAGAGVAELAVPASSMYQKVHYFSRLRYGFDVKRLYLRLEPVSIDSRRPTDGLSVRIHIQAHDDFYVDVPLTPPTHATLRRVQKDLTLGVPRPIEQAKYKHQVLELGIPFRDVDIAAGETANMTIQVLDGRVEIERYPGSGRVEVEAPDEYFEDVNWSV